MKLIALFKLGLILPLLVISISSHAVWFEATGQAVIHNGEKKAARQLATQEAIKQALMFAGASVKSVQSLTNGLLQDDRFEIRSAGEVNSIELIDEIYHDDYITVSIRADIFPQDAQCTASDYTKDIVTGWYRLSNRQHAAVGQMYDFGKVLAQKLQTESQKYTSFSQITQIEPYFLPTQNSEKSSTAIELAKKASAQYTLFGEITDFSVQTEPPATFAFWQSQQHQRNLTLALSLYDGQLGELVWQQAKQLTAPWEFDLHSSIDANSQQLWSSSFGLATQKMIQSAVQSIDDSVSCLPACGRIIQVTGEQLTINLGSKNGVKAGDTLTLFQISQFFDGQNRLQRQFQLHPEKVTVVQVFAESAQLSSLSGAPLANIQANDFVSRR